MTTRTLWASFCLCLFLAGQTTRAEEPIEVTVGAISVTPQRWDKEANLATIEKFAREAADKGTQLVITPEGFLEGYVANISQNKGLTEKAYREVIEPIDGPALTRLRSLARELEIYLAVGFAELRDGRAFNSLAVLSPEGEIALHYSKSHTLDDEPFNTHGAVFPVARTPLGRWGALICYDRQLPETARILSIKGAQVLLVPAWGNYNEMNTAMMRTRALENSVWVVFVHPNRVMVINPKGRIVAEDSGDHDQLVVETIQLDHRIGGGPIRHRRPGIYEDLLTPKRQ